MNDEARNNRRRRKKSRSAAARKGAGRLKMGLLLLAGLAVLAVSWGLPQYKKVNALRAQLSELEERKLQLQEERRRLEEELRWLQTDAAMEKIAREELGLVKPGEYPLLDLDNKSVAP